MRQLISLIRSLTAKGGWRSFGGLGVFGSILLCVVLTAQGSAAGPGPPSPRAETIPARPPEDLFNALEGVDHELIVLIDDETQGHGLARTELLSRISQITHKKHGLVAKFFHQEVYGVRLSEVVLKVDCFSTKLEEAFLHPQGASTVDRHHAIASIDAAVRCKETLERDLRGSVATPEGLIDYLGRIDKRLDEVKREVRKGTLSFGELFSKLVNIQPLATHELPHKFFKEPVYGEGKSKVSVEAIVSGISGVDSALAIAVNDSKEHPIDRRHLLVALDLAKGSKEHLERRLDHAVPPFRKPIHAVFNQQTFSTVYTEDARLRERPPAEGLGFEWAVAIPADPPCAAGFHPNTPHRDDATWYHADVGEGGPCNHAGGTYDATGRGHPGTVVVQVSNAYWTCLASYFGTQGDNGSPSGDGPTPPPCEAK